MSLLRFVGLMMMGAVPVLLLLARVALGPGSQTRFIMASRFLAMGAGAVLVSFREYGAAFQFFGSMLMGMSTWPVRAERTTTSRPT